MKTLTSECVIEADIKRCFKTSLDLDVELEAAKSSSIKAVAGRTSGVIGPGETVTWQVKQFGIWMRHTTLISGFEEPIHFQDSMVEGLFKSFVHDHYFTSLTADRTLMRDEMRFAMPWYLFGPISEELVVRRQLLEVLEKRNRVIKRVAETAVLAASE